MPSTAQHEPDTAKLAAQDGAVRIPMRWLFTGIFALKFTKLK